MSQTELLLVHGWGLGSGFWRPMLQGAQDLPQTHLVDLGFFHKQGEPRQPQPEGSWIGVGHSMGALWLLRALQGDEPGLDAETKDNCQGLIFINGFSRFARAEGFPSGVHNRVIQRMRDRLPEDTDKVLRDFAQRSGMPEMPPVSLLKPHVERLDWGLEGLQQWDGREVLARWERPFAALATRDDAIVTEAMSRSLFQESTDGVTWLDHGGHLLPLTQGEAVASHIQTCLEQWS
uniref:Putative Biotin synthesis protein BioH n=1 Tax=Magnetococcus massalia (strain MO-1) TaxID=451514 RepID=A0A1S7LNF2_MAGMO|nr:putative Biotin synthesis protein BioH [Candidatus Magnetococcus massalia]